MKKKTVKLAKLSLNKETISALEVEKITGGVSGASCACTLVPNGPSCAFTCPDTRVASFCEPCSLGGCPSVVDC